MAVTANEQTTQFVYDGDGNLVKQVKPDGSRTIYIGKVYELDADSAGTITHTTTYYPAGGAVRRDGVLSYVLKDMLNSASLVLDNAGAVTAEARYYPFGEKRQSTGSFPTDRMFTGQQEMTGLGSMYNYNARFTRRAWDVS